MAKFKADVLHGKEYGCIVLTIIKGALRARDGFLYPYGDTLIMDRVRP
jgi:hypothetical protein